MWGRENHTIRKIPSGWVTTLAGLAGNSGSTGQARRFSGPYGVAVDTSGNVYVADSNNQTIRKGKPLPLPAYLLAFRRRTAYMPAKYGKLDGSSGATGYEVWLHTTDNSGAASRLSTATGTSYDDTTVSAVRIIIGL